MRNYLTYDNKDIRDFGVYISGKGTFNSPSRDVEYIQIPGRNGDLTIDNGRFNNVELEYEAFIVRNFKTNFGGLRSFLFAKNGYKRLEDSFHPEEFRMASVSERIEPDMTKLLREGKFEILFNCKPQRFLKIGEHAVKFLSNGVIGNDTLYDSKPLLRVYGAGTIVINNQIIRVTRAPGSGYTDIDCEIMDAYCGTETRNAYVSFESDSVVLKPGDNSILLTGVTADITPRWWVI